MIRYRREMDLRGQLYLALAVSALLWLSSPLFAGILMNVSGTIVGFDQRTVTLQLDNGPTQIRIPRAALNDRVVVRPGNHAMVTLNNAVLRQTSVRAAKRGLSSPLGTATVPSGSRRR